MASCSSCRWTGYCRQCEWSPPTVAGSRLTTRLSSTVAQSRAATRWRTDDGDRQEGALHDVRDGTSSTSTGAVTTGKAVLVLGTAEGMTITASQVIVQPAGAGPTAGSASKGVAVPRGAPATAKRDGPIPANYSGGSGTIVGGASANKATTAARASSSRSTPSR